MNEPELIPTGRKYRPSTVWAIAIGSAIAAGLVAWSVGEYTQGLYIGKLSKIPVMGGTMDSVLFEDAVIRDVKNGTLTYGMMGGVLGLILGLAGGLVSRSPRSAAIGGLAGLVIGASLGFTVTKLLLVIYFHQMRDAEGDFTLDLVLPFLIHAGIWSSIAAAAGGAFGLGLGAGGTTIAKAAVGGLAGGVLAAVVYEVVGALAFPLGNTNHPIATHWPPRMIAAMLLPLFTAAFAAFAILSPTHRPSRVVSP